MHLFAKVRTIVNNIGLDRVADTHQHDIGNIDTITFVFWNTNTQDHIVIIVVLHRTIDGLKGIEYRIRIRLHRIAFRQIDRRIGGRSAISTGLPGVVATGIGTDVIVPDKGILVTY